MDAGVVEEKKYCVSCKHLIGMRHYANDETVLKWKCAHPNNIEEVYTDPVLGVEKKKFKEIAIYVVRTHSCEGNWYELYEQPTAPVEKSPLIEEAQPAFKHKTLGASDFKKTLGKFKLGEDL